jgi:hypothetical protein
MQEIMYAHEVRRSRTFSKLSCFYILFSNALLEVSLLHSVVHFVLKKKAFLPGKSHKTLRGPEKLSKTFFSGKTI